MVGASGHGRGGPARVVGGARQGGAMICCVDLEHPERGPSMLTEAPEAPQRKADLVTVAARFERLSGEPCLLQHFSRVDHDGLAGLGVQTVILSGHSTLIDDYAPADVAPLLDLIRRSPGPLLPLSPAPHLIRPPPRATPPPP